MSTTDKDTSRGIDALLSLPLSVLGAFIKCHAASWTLAVYFGVAVPPLIVFAAVSVWRFAKPMTHHAPSTQMQKDASLVSSATAHIVFTLVVWLFLWAFAPAVPFILEIP